MRGVIKLGIKITKSIFGLLVNLKEWHGNVIWGARLNKFGGGSRISGRAVVYQASKMSVGSGCVINDYVHIWAGGGIYIGDDVLIAAHTVITSVTHDGAAFSAGLRYKDTRITKEVRIGNNVWIGSSVVIMPGITVGDNAIVGAGSVVTRDVLPNSVVAGVPAREIRKILMRD